MIDGASSASPVAATRTASSSRSAGASLSRNPLAPIRSASKTYSSASNVVSMITRGVEAGRREDPLGRAEPVELGHPDVHQHHVGAAPAYDVDRSAPVGRLADHGDVGLGLEDHAEAGAQQPLVVRQHDGDRGGRDVHAAVHHRARAVAA